jgi:3-oxoacyl-[acyl-carrier protein] reductase
MLSNIAMRRLGEPDDIAAACAFLASDRASFITGQVLPVTGHPFP